MRTTLCIILAVFLNAAVPLARAGQEFEFTSSDQRTNLLELYVSQGCSSCPPAQKWVNEFVHDGDLWDKIIPVVFHVDYFDYLGWKDPFASPDFTRRQHEQRSSGHVASVYTPGFVLNGKEWRDRERPGALKDERTPAGKLSVHGDSGQLEVHFETKPQMLRLNVAVLGFDIASHVTAGENNGRQLKEEFIVLSYGTYSSDNGRWTLAMPEAAAAVGGRRALVVWIDRPDDLTPLQAIGGWL